MLANFHTLSTTEQSTRLTDYKIVQISPQNIHYILFIYQLCCLKRLFRIWLTQTMSPEPMKQSTPKYLGQFVAIKLRAATGPVLSLGQQTQKRVMFFQFPVLRAEQPSNFIPLYPKLLAYYSCSAILDQANSLQPNVWLLRCPIRSQLNSFA